MRAAWLLALLLTATTSAAHEKETLTPQRRQELEKKILELNRAGLQHYQRGNLGPATELFREVLALRRQQYPKEQFPSGHSALVKSLNNLAGMYRAAGDHTRAEPLCREALAMSRALYPPDQLPRGHPDLCNSLSHLGSLRLAAGDFAEAATLLREALALDRARYPLAEFPRGHVDIARSLNNLAFLHQAAGEYAQAELLYREALDIYRAAYPREKFPRGHPELVLSLNNLATLYRDVGENGKAEPLCREALALCRVLYPPEQFPRGHRNLASSLQNLAVLHLEAGGFARAESLYREALTMCRALYPPEQFPQGHHDLARSVINLASVYLEAKEFARARPLYQEALVMHRAMYSRARFPQGHRTLAISMQNLAVLHQAAGEYDQAEPLYREALAMIRALRPPDLFPSGHPDLALGLHNLASLYQALGQHDKAEPLYREALAMHQQLLLRHADLAAEAACLNYLQSFPLARDGLLMVSRDRPTSASVYEALWDARGALTRLQQRRHRDRVAGRDPDTAALADDLRRTSQGLAHLLLAPGTDAARRRAEVDRLTQTKEDLERRLNARLKLAPLPAARALSPRRLAEALPAGAAFVDLYRYVEFAHDPKVSGRTGGRHTPRYVAFVVRKGRPVARVELQEAAPIDAAQRAWRQAITAARPDEAAERRAAAALARLVWGPLRAALPAGLRTVYIAPDPKLSQVPWGALPGPKPDTILLDECAVCLVPHGPFLLERLLPRPAERAGGTLVVYGGIDYDSAPDTVARREEPHGPLLRGKGVKWSALPGTAREQEQVLALARKVLREPPLARSGAAATARQLEADLPRARYAHLATHGFFADAKFRSALQVEPGLFDYHGFGDRRGGARSPLVLSGLVLAGANRQGEAAADRGIVTAEGLVGLRLEGLELAVLSACETGLGEDGGGEGVYGLQRALHVAGCRDVVASLWKVDDQATQALMALFYRNLWERRTDPAEALRQAQRTLYRHPEAVQVARQRGADFSESDLPAAEPGAAARPARSPAGQWAAFTYSGVRPPQR
jgi:CHAT domain-containing protein/Tfp pilus assembly protein PilF